MSSDHYDTSRHDAVGYDPSDGAYHLHHDWTDSSPLSYTVLTAVAAITGDEPHKLDPLTDTVDPDALDKIFAPGRIDPESVDARLTLRFNRCLVTIHADGHLVIEPPTE